VLEKKICSWHCHRGEDCEDECVLQEQTTCYSKRIPEKRKRICHDFWQRKMVRKCLSVCIQPEKIHISKGKTTSFELLRIRNDLIKMTRKIQKKLSKFGFAKRTIQLAQRIQRRTREILNNLKNHPESKDIKVAKRLTHLFK